jgi:membrane protease YdiL (CAAX protease family)
MRDFKVGARPPFVPLMEQVFDGRTVADPGTPRLRRVFWIISAILIFLVVFTQQSRVVEHWLKPMAKAAEKADPAKIEPLGTDMDAADMTGRVVVKLGAAGGGVNRAQLAPMVDPSQQDDLPTAVKMVPAYAEMGGAEGGARAAKDLRKKVDQQRKELGDKQAAALTADLDALEALYTQGVEAADPAVKARIEKRLGWQGRLALTIGKPDTDPERKELLANGELLVGVLLGIVLAAVPIVLASIGLAIWACVLLSTGKLRPRFPRPAPGGSLGVEMLTVFLAAFLGLKIFLDLAEAAIGAGWFGTVSPERLGAIMLPVHLLLQWIVLPIVVFYPRLRGYSTSRVKRAIGWHRGEGFGREVMAGLAGYLACLPLYVVAVIIAAVLAVLERVLVKELTGGSPDGPVNPIGEMLSQSPWLAVLLVVLATVWAPIVEESVFRGALFTQLYARFKLVWAALLSGTVFAMMHGYSPSLFPPLIALGAGFAIIRWWRGSLIATMTAHALHNGTVTLVLLVLFSLLK